MFTGIIEEMGRFMRAEHKGESMVLTVSARKVLNDVHVGDSISVNGVCLTVTSYDSQSFTVDVMPETFRNTNLSNTPIGSRVNLERAMAANGRFGGHIVQGHVDGTGKIVGRTPEHNAVVFRIEPQAPLLLKYIIPKGSITIDGISLTVVETNETSFTVSIIPHTLAETVLQDKSKGDTVNLETDILGKYIEHLLKFGKPSSTGERKQRTITADFLAEHGFA